MGNETKTPQAGEWWVSNSGRTIIFFVGDAPDGYQVAMWPDYSFARGKIWSDWHHEPRCDSFDWVEQPAIDPGEGWELLPVGTVLQEGDEFWCVTKWVPTSQAGDSTAKPELHDVIYRRRKPPAETWPKYYEVLYQQYAYIKRLSEAKYIVVKTDGTEGMEFKWKSYMGDNRKQITEAEALARVKTANPLPALIPGIATDRMVDLFLSWRLPSDFQPDGGIVFTSRPANESWPTGTNLFTATQARGMIEHLLSVPGETSRVQPAEPIDTAKRWLADNPAAEDPPPFAKPFTDARSGMGIQKDHVSWRPNSGQYDAATDVTYHAETPVESPDDWIEITDPEHVLREGIDEVWYSFEDIINEWQQVFPSAGMRLNDSQYKRARCRRRDLPAPPIICTCPTLAGVQVTGSSCPAHGLPYCELTPAPQPKTMDVSPGEGWRWVEKDEPWQEGDDCLICDFKHAHTHNCQCWRRRIAPQPKRTPVRLFVSADVRWGDRYIVSVKDGNPNPERHQEVKFDGRGFYVEGE